MMRVVSRITLIAALAAAVIASSRYAAADGPSYGVSAVPPVAGVAPGDVVGPAAGVPVIGPTVPPPTVNIPDLLSIFGPYPPGAAQVNDISYGASFAFAPGLPLFAEFSTGPGLAGAATTGHPAAPPPPLPLIDVREEAGLIPPGPFGGGSPDSGIFTNWPAGFTGSPACGPVLGNIQLLDGAGTSIPPFGLRLGLNLPPGSNLNKYDRHGSTFVGGPGIPTKPVFFTINAASPWPGGPIPSPLGPMVPGSADVIAFDPLLPGFIDWAPAPMLGLVTGDSIAALTVSYGGAPLPAGFGAGGAAAPDQIWFTLAPGSLSLAPTSGGSGLPAFKPLCSAPGTGTAADIWTVTAPFAPPAAFLDAEMLGLNAVRSGGTKDDAIDAMDFAHCPDMAGTMMGRVDPDCNGDLDFANPGPGLPCVQDHVGDANGDGYSDADELTAAGAPPCTGAYPTSGGLGHANVNLTCPGRPAGSAAAKIAKTDVNVDGIVSLIDMAMVGKNFGSAVSGIYDPRAETDINGDGSVNTIDLAYVGKNFLKPVPAC